MKHHLAKKMYHIHGFCFDPCTVEMETDLKKAGLYEQYEKRMMSGNMKAFADDIESWVTETISTTENYVTEDGTIETWGGMSTKKVDEILKGMKDYVEYIREKS